MSCTSALSSGPCLEIVQGTTFQAAFAVSGIDLTGASAVLSFRGGYPKADLIVASTSTGELTVIVTTPITNQTITCEIDELLTATEIPSGMWDLIVTVGTDVIALVGGTYKFTRI